VTLALQHHLVSDFTSLVAVDVTPTRPESEQLNSQSIVKKRKAHLSSNYNPQDTALESELALFEAELAQFIQQSSKQLNSSASSSAFLAMAAASARQSSAYALPANSYAAAKVPASAIVVPASRTATNSQLFMYVGVLILLLAFILRRRKPV